MGVNEVTTHIPEHTSLGSWWNGRARGLGATTDRPVSTAGEENALCYRYMDLSAIHFMAGNTLNIPHLIFKIHLFILNLHCVVKSNQIPVVKAYHIIGEHLR